jgi:hypothetical protein
MISRTGRALACPSLAVLLALTLLAVERTANALEGDVFDDYKRAGSGDDARRKPDNLSVVGLSLEPSLDWKLADLITPHFFLGEALGYSTNILRGTRGDEQRDFLSRTEGGARADLQLLDHVMSAEYRFTGYLYPKEHELDALEHQVRGRLDLNFLPGNVHAEGGWTRSQFSRNILIRGKIREDDYDASTFGRVELGRFVMGAGMGFQRADYLDEPSLQRFDHKVFLASAQVGAKVTEGLRAVLDYNYEAVRFDRRVLSDFDVHGARAGVSGNVSPKLSFSAMAGADFQQIVRKAPGSTDDHSYHGFAAESSLTFRALDTTEVSLAYRRDLLWSPSSNFQTTDLIQLAVAQKLFEEKVVVNATFGYEHVDPSRGAPLDRLHPSLRVTWLVKQWLHTSLFYVYDRGFSSTKTNDYEEHRVELSVGVGF